LEATDSQQVQTQPSSRHFDTRLTKQHVSLTVGDFFEFGMERELARPLVVSQRSARI
jgi:hypothetical protein